MGEERPDLLSTCMVEVALKELAAKDANDILLLALARVPKKLQGFAIGEAFSVALRLVDDSVVKEKLVKVREYLVHALDRRA